MTYPRKSDAGKSGQIPPLERFGAGSREKIPLCDSQVEKAFVFC